jgi:spore coat polysaccharide biosynthesis protein SpsF
MKVVAIIQARMGSTRLPGKVLLDLAGEPMLVRDVNRVRRATLLHEVVVATTMESEDDAIVSLCASRGWSCSRGSQDDVLDRYYQTAVAYDADVVVRITSDCPLIDPDVVDLVVREFLKRQPGIDYASNVLPHRTYPRGLDTEVMRFDALERAWREDTNPALREHVTPYIYRNEGRFRMHGVTSSVDHSAMRWTVDTPEDLGLVRHIYDHFGHDRFSWLEVLAVVQRHPEWLDINRHVKQKEV